MEAPVSEEEPSHQTAWYDIPSSVLSLKALVGGGVGSGGVEPEDSAPHEHTITPTEEHKEGKEEKEEEEEGKDVEDVTLRTFVPTLSDNLGLSSYVPSVSRITFGFVGAAEEQEGGF